MYNEKGVYIYKFDKITKAIKLQKKLDKKVLREVKIQWKLFPPKINKEKFSRQLRLKVKVILKEVKKIIYTIKRYLQVLVKGEKKERREK